MCLTQIINAQVTSKSVVSGGFHILHVEHLLWYKKRVLSGYIKTGSKHILSVVDLHYILNILQNYTFVTWRFR